MPHQPFSISKDRSEDEEKCQVRHKGLKNEYIAPTNDEMKIKLKYAAHSVNPVWKAGAVLRLACATQQLCEVYTEVYRASVGADAAVNNRDATRARLPHIWDP